MQRTFGVVQNADPVSTAALASLGRADHVDAVAVDLKAGTTAIEFARAALVSPPDWIHKLMGLRDAIVRPLGLRTAARVEKEMGQIEILAGRRIGPFKVLSVAEHEVLLGDDDKHLRFRTSFSVRSRADGTEGVCTTVVAHENLTGRVYFALIKPFHNLVVTGIVGHAAAVLKARG